MFVVLLNSVHHLLIVREKFWQQTLIYSARRIGICFFILVIVLEIGNMSLKYVSFAIIQVFKRIAFPYSDTCLGVSLWDFPFFL